MNDDIIRMAQEACETTNWKPGLGNEHVVEFMARFASLVRADEREACAKMCDDLADISGHYAIAATAIRKRGEE